MRNILASILFLALLVSCNRSNGVDSSSQIVFADTVVYEALIHSVDASATWELDWLKGLNREAYINKLFDLVYSKKIKVIDYDTQQALSIDEVKEWEQYNPRSTIGKLQFTETWGFNNGNFNKRIIAIMPAYEVFTDEGELRAYKAKVKMLMVNE